MNRLFRNSISIAVLPLVSLASNAALSASTANVIQGTPPALTFDNGQMVITNIDELLSITYEDKSGNKKQYTPKDTLPIKINTTETLSQFSAHLSTGGFHDLSTLTPISSYYVDSDGDEVGSIQGYFVANWTYQEPSSFGMSTQIVPTEQLSQPLDPCKSPYTLTIQTYGVTVNSAYGLPASNDYGDNSKAEYQVEVQDFRLCYLQPIDADANISQTNPNLGGFNTNLFERYKGFNITGLNSTGKSFPTIAFDKASFIMKMSNNQSDYTFASNNAIVDINNTTGIVTFNSTTRPELPIDVTLTATPKNTASPTITYQFSVTDWARVIGTSVFADNVDLSLVTDFTALSICSGQAVNSTSHPVYNEPTKYMFAANKITNSADHTEFFYRDADGTLQGEWGKLNKYSNSKWDLGLFIWTAEPSTDIKFQDVVTISSGRIGGVNRKSSNAVLACRT